MCHKIIQLAVSIMVVLVLSFQYLLAQNNENEIIHMKDEAFTPIHESFNKEIQRISNGMAELLSKNELLSYVEDSSLSSEALSRSEKDFLAKRLQTVITNEIMFMQFHVLRDHVSKITLVWEVQGAKNEIKKFIVPPDRLKHWKRAFLLSITREFTSPYTGQASKGDYSAFPEHNSIILETDNAKVFIAITPYGFQLGPLKNNRFSRALLFQSDGLSSELRTSVEINLLDDFPKHIIPVPIRRYPCPDDVRLPENAGRNAESGAKMSEE